MPVQQIDRSHWLRFFDQFSDTLRGRQAKVEAASLALGDQLLADSVALLGISYDPHDDVIDIHLEGEDHRIAKPTSVFVDYAVGGLVGLEIVDGEGTRALVKLAEALMLPAPEVLAG